MKKTVLLFAFLSIALLADAQKALIRAGESMLPKFWEPAPQIMLSAKIYRPVVLEMQEIFASRIVPTDVNRLRVEAFHASDQLNKQIDDVYLSAITLANELADYLNAKVWYTLHDEEYAMTAAEIREGLSQVTKVSVAIHQAELFLKPGDKPLEMAKMKVENAYRFYQIYATGVVDNSFPKTLVDAYKQTAMSFNKKVFFLEDPILPAPRNLLKGVLSRFSKSPLAFPKTLKMAVVTDLSVRRDIEAMADEENLMDWTIDGYKTPEEFLDSPKHLSYDLVLTDILIPGGGGIYLTRQLREQGFKGGIVATTAYPDEKDIGVKLKTDGMNGMITLSLSNLDDYEMLNRKKTLARKMRNYFYYQNNPTAVEFTRGNILDAEE